MAEDEHTSQCEEAVFLTDFIIPKALVELTKSRSCEM